VAAQAKDKTNEQVRFGYRVFPNSLPDNQPLRLGGQAQYTWSYVSTQSLDQPGKGVNAQSITRLDSNVLMELSELSMRLAVGTFSKDNNFYALSFLDAGVVQTSVNGEVYLTHSSDRSSACAQAVNTQSAAEVQLYCEKRSFSVRQVGPIFRIGTEIGLRPRFVEKFGVFVESPLHVKTDNVEIRYTSSVWLSVGGSF